MSTIELMQEVERLQVTLSDREAMIAKKEKEISAKDALIKELESKIAVLNILHFGPKSEKLTYEDERQGRLFNEAEEEAFAQADQEKSKACVETREVASYVRRAHNRNQGRKPISKDLPRRIVTHDIPEEKKDCACGDRLSCIGYEKAERLEIKPIEVTVTEERRLKYACKGCEGTESDSPGVITACGKKHLIPGSIATSSLLAWTLTEKFEYALPFYRQEKRLEQIGVPIPRATLSGFAIRAAEKCKPLYELLKNHIRSGSLINADETTVQVLTEPDRKPQEKSYMCVYLRGTSDKKAVAFVYNRSRASEVHKVFLKDFKGQLQTDDLSVYHTTVRELNKDRPDKDKIKHMLCWAHARRKFHQAWKATGSEHAAKGLEFIKYIFALESLRDNHSVAGFVKLRKNKAEIIFSEFRSWLMELSPKLPPQNLTSKAIAYTLDNWEQLITYVDDPDCVPSNNLAENAIRPFVVGRKNWLFCETPAGAEASAIMYSLIETAKLNSLKPYDCLWYIFERLPYAVTDEDLLALLPFNLTPEQIKPPRE
jgi:transposase